jgi:zinc and cadmium transporter
MPTTLLLVPVVATLCGGFFAIRFRRWIHGLLAVGAGLLLGAAFLDLLPEAISIGTASGIDVSRTLTITLISFLGFFLIENVLDSLSSGTDARVPRRSIGRIAGGMLVFHSFRDGMAIGAAFAASHTAGYAVAAGIAAHDLGDGMNTVLLTTAGEKPRGVDYSFLVADALAPFAGGIVAIWWFSSAASTVALLGVAAGFFIQMAATEFLPEVKRSDVPRKYVVPCVLGGVGLIYTTNLLLGKLR